MSAPVAVCRKPRQPGEIPSSISLPDSKPTEMSTEDLANFVADAFAKIKTALPYIIELRERFAALPRGKANVMNCRTWTEFCSKVLHRTDSAIRKVIAAEYVTKGEKEKRRKAEAEWERQLAEMEKEESEEQKAWDALPEEEKARQREAECEKDERERQWRQRQQAELRRNPPECLFCGRTPLPDNLKPTASEIVEAGYRALAKQRHPDIGGSQEAMALLNSAVSSLRKMVGA